VAPAVVLLMTGTVAAPLMADVAYALSPQPVIPGCCQLCLMHQYGAVFASVTGTCNGGGCIVLVRILLAHANMLLQSTSGRMRNHNPTTNAELRKVHLKNPLLLLTFLLFSFSHQYRKDKPARAN
jgi:hypothetical protein